jgi:hypothetical protein
MLTARKLRIAWKAYIAAKVAMQMLDRPSAAEVARRQQGYFRWRLTEALDRLSTDSEHLGEVLEEIFLIATGVDEIIDWRPVTLVEARTRIGEPLIAPKMETNAAER